MRHFAAGLHVVGLLCGMVSAAPADPVGEAEAKPSPLAEVVTATLVGGEGTEWLASGGFTADGRVILAGTSLDAEVVIGGLKAKVIGKDAPPLEPVTGLKPVMALQTTVLEEMEYPTTDKFGQIVMKRVSVERKVPPGKAVMAPRKDADGNPVYETLTWRHPNATGFVAIAAPGLKKILSVHRLPRGAGSITSAAVAADGSIYIAGAAGDGIASAAADFATTKAGEATGEIPWCYSTYVARLQPDAASAVWVRRLIGYSFAPKVRIMADGSIGLVALGVHILSPAGKILHSLVRPAPGFMAVSPVDRTVAVAASWMIGTGREPWRSGWLYVYRPDGRMRLQLYDWPGGLVGVNAFRLVADSTIRKILFDGEGNLVAFGWSHGGNSVNARLPYDLERFWPYNGLNYHIWGSASYVVRMDPADYRVKAATTWLTTTHVYSVGWAADGSLAWSGTAGLLKGRTANALSALPEGPAVAVCNPELTAYRFFSAVPACGVHLAVGGTRKIEEEWGFATGRPGGRCMLLMLTGAIDKQRRGGRTFSPPVVGAMQPAFAGGLMDGYAVLLDLSRCAVVSPVQPPGPDKPPPTDPARPIIERRQTPRHLPHEGQQFTVEPRHWYSTMISFRDPTDRKWPVFFCGRPEAKGSFTYPSGRPEPALSFLCDVLAQPQGEQDGRILGQLIRARWEDYTDDRGRQRRRLVTEPNVRFVLRTMSPWRQEEVATLRGNLRDIRTRLVCDVSGDLHVAGRKVAVDKALCSGSFRVEADGVFRSDPNAKPNVADLACRFTVKGADLGLNAQAARGDVLVGVAFTGTAKVVYFTPPKLEDHVPTIRLKD